MPDQDVRYCFNGAYCSKRDMRWLSRYFESLKNRQAQASVSELHDIGSSRIRKESHRVLSALRRPALKPFLFVHCLN